MNIGDRVYLNENFYINCVDNCLMIGTNIFPIAEITNSNWMFIFMNLRLNQYLEENLN